MMNARQWHVSFFAMAALCVSSVVVSSVGGIDIAGRLWAEEEMPAGLQVGDRPREFQVLDCTGPAAGKTLCYYCRYGRRPVACVFVRTLDKHVVDLASQLNRAVEQHRDDRLAAFVVYLADDPFAAGKQLQALAEQHEIRIPLTVFRDTPRVLQHQLQISPTAAVTVLMWVDGEVQFHQAFEEKKFDESAVPKVLRGVEQMLTQQTKTEDR